MVDKNLQVTFQISSPDFGKHIKPWTPGRNIKKMLQDDDLLQPDSPVKELEQKLSPFRDQIFSDLKGKLHKLILNYVGIKNNDAEVQALIFQIDDLYDTIELINFKQ